MDDSGFADRDERFRRIFEAKRAGDVAYLIRALADPDHRSTVAWYLSQLGAVEAIPQLTRLLDADQQATRTAAAKALGRLRASDAVSRLIEVAERDPSDVTRSYAVGALGQIGDPRAKDVLHRILDDREVWLRRGAATALAAVGDESSFPRIREAARAEPLWRRGRYLRATRAIKQRLGRRKSRGA